MNLKSGLSLCKMGHIRGFIWVEFVVVNNKMNPKGGEFQKYFSQDNC